VAREGADTARTVTANTHQFAAFCIHFHPKGNVIMGTSVLRFSRHLIMALEGLGFVAGCPPHITTKSRAIDRRLCQSLRCRECRKQGLSYKPFQKGGTYRVVAICPRCRAQQEV
jgi:hypothetical protein